MIARGASSAQNATKTASLRAISAGSPIAAVSGDSYR
jgi:hypothetical protein